MEYHISESSQFKIYNETDLHYKVIDFIRKYQPNAIIVPGLGENQKTAVMRYDSKCKGYQPGTCDILLLNRHNEFSGLAIELKTPSGKGVVSDNQATFLDALQENGFKIIISNNFEEVIIQLYEYFKGFVQMQID